MFYPTYVWIIFNWYRDKFWEAGSCVRDGSVKSKDLERVLRYALVTERNPKIEDEDVDVLNVGKIVSYFCKHFMATTEIDVYSWLIEVQLCMHS